MVEVQAEQVDDNGGVEPLVGPMWESLGATETTLRLLARSPAPQHPQKSPARSPYLPYHRRGIEVLRRQSPAARCSQIVLTQLSTLLVASLLLPVHLALEATRCVLNVTLVLVLAQGVDQHIHMPLLNGVSQYAFHNTRDCARAPRVGCTRTRLIL